MIPRSQDKASASEHGLGCTALGLSITTPAWLAVTFAPLHLKLSWWY